MKHTPTIYDKLCLGCGEISPDGQGLFAMIEHKCPLNTVIYRPQRFKLSMFEDILYAMDGRQKPNTLKDLLTYEHFPHFSCIGTHLRPMQKHPLNNSLYAFAREYEIKQMKRIRAWIEIEDAFEATY